MIDNSTKGNKERLFSKLEKLKIPVFVTTLWAIIQTLEPSKIDSLNLSFVLWFLKNTWFEFFVLISIGCCWIYWVELNALRKRSFQWLKLKSLPTQAFIYLLLSVNLFTAFLLIVERTEHYSNFYHLYSYSMHKKLEESINKGEYLKAIDLCKTINEKFPYEDAESINKVKTNISDRYYYGSKYYSIALFNINDTLKVSRIAYFNLLSAFCLHPNDNYRNRIMIVSKRLKSLDQVPNVFYDAVTAKNMQVVDDILNNYQWFLFEDEAINRIKSKKGTWDYGTLESLFFRIKREQYRDYVLKSWRQNEALGLVNYHNNASLVAGDN